MGKFRLTIEVETRNDSLDWSVTEWEVDDYTKRKLEEEGELKVINIGVKEID